MVSFRGIVLRDRRSSRRKTLAGIRRTAARPGCIAKPHVQKRQNSFSLWLSRIRSALRSSARGYRNNCKNMSSELDRRCRLPADPYASTKRDSNESTQEYLEQVGAFGSSSLVKNRGSRSRYALPRITILNPGVDEAISSYKRFPAFETTFTKDTGRDSDVAKHSHLD